MSLEYFYEVDLKWDADRRGTLSSTALNKSIEVVTPPEFLKGIEGEWSPEHLFIASVSSCLMTTFLSIAELSKLEYVSLTISALGKLEKKDGKLMISEIELKPVLTIPASVNENKAERILHKSESACLISNSITSTVITKPEIIVQEEAVI